MERVLGVVAFCGIALLVWGTLNPGWSELKPGVSGVPPLMHTIWMSNPLRPYVLTGLDSAVHYMPEMLIKLHIIVPDGATAKDIAGFRETFERQLEPLTSRPETQIQIVMHDDIPTELAGSPLDGLGITQAHLGGTMEILRANEADPGGGNDRQGNSHAGHFSMSHATDLLRIWLLWKEGGVYFDSDVLFLRDIRPVIEESGCFSICQNILDMGGPCRMTSFFAVSTPGHPFAEMVVENARQVIAEKKVNSVFPYTHELATKKRKARWTILMDAFGGAWSKFSAVGDLAVDALKEKRQGGLGVTYNFSGGDWTAFGLRYWTLKRPEVDTLRKPATAQGRRERLEGYILHLWEKSDQSDSNVRARYLDYIRKDTLIAAIYHVVCLAYCDPEELERSANLA